MMPRDSTTAQPLCSSQGPLALDDLSHEHVGKRKSTELQADIESETLELRNRSLQDSWTLRYFKYLQYICNDFASD